MENAVLRSREELNRAVLTASLWMESSKGSSRHVAESVGVSQSFVSRTWRELLASNAAADEVRAVMAGRQMLLVGLAIGPTGSCLVMKPSRASRTAYPVGLSINSKRRLRAVLSADLLRSEQNKDATRTGQDLWPALETNGHGLSDAVAVLSGDFAAPPGVRTLGNFADAWQWQKLVTALDLLPEASTKQVLLDLEWRLRRWYQEGRPPFMWTLDSSQAAVETSGHAALRNSYDGLAENILGAIRQGLIDGKFAGESEISTGTLSRLLGMPVRDVRSAVRALTDDGLVTAARSDSIVVRIPSLDDVSETYMARRALGAIAVRAASRWGPDARSQVKDCLEGLMECVAGDDLTRAHYLDMDFQIALFRASGLTRIPAMMETLTKQAFMHFAVIGGRYAFAPLTILEQNREIFEAIDAADLQAATLLWHIKMEDGLNYVAQHIAGMSQHRQNLAGPASRTRTHSRRAKRATQR